jgi:type II secretory pathway component PulF
MASRLAIAFALIQFGFRARVKFYKEFAALLRAGMAKSEAIALLATVASDEGRRTGEPDALILGEVLRAMRNGQSFGEAIRPFVPPDDRMILEAIENSDDFPGQLDAYCATMRKKRQIVGTILSGLTYPVFLFLMVLGMLVYFGRSIVPQMGRLLPVEDWQGAARFLAALGDFAQGPALVFVISTAVVLTAVTFSLARWRGRLRILADRLPIYALYRVYTGISFMVALAALMRGGMPPIAAIERILPTTTPYVRERLVLIRRGILNGLDFGEALHRSGTSWPDYNMALSIKIFSRTQDLSKQMAQLATDWLDATQEGMERSMATTRTLSLVVVFLVIIGVVAGMYDLQSQIAASVQ